MDLKHLRQEIYESFTGTIRLAGVDVCVYM